MKGHLPKAYLRIDPNLAFAHPDPGAFITLLCAAHSQPWRGRFSCLNLIRRAVGHRAAKALLQRGDVIVQGDVYYVDGWDEWQEGDFTVGERMRRLREKRITDRNASVTESPPLPSPIPSPPSEASGVRRQASETETENERQLSVGSESGNGHATMTDEQRQEYADAVWSKFIEHNGLSAARLASPVEFAVLKGWMDAGIPLRVVLRGIEDTKGKGGSLAYYAASVAAAEEHWRRALA